MGRSRAHFLRCGHASDDRSGSNPSYPSYDVDKIVLCRAPTAAVQWQSRVCLHVGHINKPTANAAHKVL